MTIIERESKKITNKQKIKINKQTRTEKNKGDRSIVKGWVLNDSAVHLS